MNVIEIESENKYSCFICFAQNCNRGTNLINLICLINLMKYLLFLAFQKLWLDV